MLQVVRFHAWSVIGSLGNMEQTIDCKFWMQGACKRGDTCYYKHDVRHLSCFPAETRSAVLDPALACKQCVPVAWQSVCFALCSALCSTDAPLWHYHGSTRLHAGARASTLTDPLRTALKAARASGARNYPGLAILSAVRGCLIVRPCAQLSTHIEPSTTTDTL